MPTVRIVVRGRVQGVGFRNFVFITACSMGVSGEVWNRSDGSVAAIAEHPDPTVIDAFGEAMEAGPGYVRDVQIEPTAKRGYERFEIGASRD